MTRLRDREVGRRRIKKKMLWIAGKGAGGGNEDLPRISFLAAVVCLPERLIII
jgi:hypothetical protein